MKIEKELRFVLTSSEYENFKYMVLQNKKDFIPGNAVLETTTMYDNPNPDMSFYNEEIDGRLRVRTVSEGIADIFDIESKVSESLLTWKQRIHEKKEGVCKEKELEVKIATEEMHNMIHIFEDILHSPRVSSYERYRETFFTIDMGIEIASDLFPYGHVIEFEIKHTATEKDLFDLAKKLGIKMERISTKSCDDMYRWLCECEGKNVCKDILFNDKNMPKIDRVLA